MTEANKPEATPTPKQGRFANLKNYLPSKGQAAVGIIALLALSNLGLWVKLEREQQPVIVTVGVRELSQGYVAKIALSEATPEEAAVKTEMFLAATQDTVRRAAERGNVLLLARECVLAGETADITKEVGEAVELAMAEAGAAIKPALARSTAPVNIPLAAPSRQPAAE